MRYIRDRVCFGGKERKGKKSARSKKHDEGGCRL